ncbi:MAG TPA: glycosyltransferase [Pyrinomonadaceae bacterium]|jgi:glycosyltransferase involved in cell wall biosynthesis
MIEVLPISAIVPTRNRAASLEKMLHSLARQVAQPLEMIVIDASLDDSTRLICRPKSIEGLATQVQYVTAHEVGAASQRNQGVKLSTQKAILFVDDDVVFEPDCIARQWTSLNSNPRFGGVSSMIVNQRYHSPGLISRWLFWILNGRTEQSYAGRCIGPALNLLPEDDPNLPDTVEVEWLNTTCTLYRKDALPDPVFADHFTGYSFMEDVALSLIVGKTWKLANARTARIYHDSQTADYKKDKLALAKMELINRHYVMTQVLGRNRFRDYAKLAMLETFGVVSPLVKLSAWKTLLAVLWGKGCGITVLLRLRGDEASQRIIAEKQTPVSPA